MVQNAENRRGFPELARTLKRDEQPVYVITLQINTGVFNIMISSKRHFCHPQIHETLPFVEHEEKE